MTIMLWGVTTDRVREWARQQDGGRELNGAAASPGVVEGPARVVRSVSEIADVRDGEILVCGSTSPAWAPIFTKIRATVTDVGGVMSHAAIVCREYGLPAVVGTGRATAQIQTGQTIRVDGSAGVVTLLGERCDDRRPTRAPLGDLRGADEPAFGGKSAGLGELLGAGITGAPGVRAVDLGARSAFMREGGLEPLVERELAGRRSRSARVGAARVGGDRRGDRARRRWRTRSPTSLPSATPSSARASAATRPRWPCARARSARTAATRRSPASRTTLLWVRGVRRSARRGARLLGEPVQRAGDHLPRASSATAARSRWAWPCS